MDDNGCILYADDTTLVFADKDVSILESKANKYIGYIYSWLCYNKLSLHLLSSSILQRFVMSSQTN